MEQLEEDIFLKKRSYIHFDLVKSDKCLRAFFDSSFVESNIAKHSFYPFIQFSIVQGKIYRNQNHKARFKKKIRSIMYAAHLDSAIYSYYNKYISDIYEKFLEDNKLAENVLAFRALGKSNINFAHQAFNIIRDYGDCVVLCFDVTGFFDNLNHDYLKSMWLSLLDKNRLSDSEYKIYQSLTKYSFVNKKDIVNVMNLPERHLSKNLKVKRLCSPQEFREKIRDKGYIKVNRSNKGIPQGSPLSAVLSNIYMMDFDKRISDIINAINGCYFRYCDDILLIIKKEFVNKIKDDIFQEIKNIHLELKDEKTDIVYFYVNQKGEVKCSKPLKYLGLGFDGCGVFIRESTLGRFAKKLRIKNRFSSTRKLYFRKRFSKMVTHHGNKNFHRYGYRASDITGSINIRKQIRPFWKEFKEAYSNISS